MTTSFRLTGRGNDRLQITIELTAEETRVLGIDAETMAESLDSAYWALGMLRTGRNSRDAGSPLPRQEDWHVLMRDLTHYQPRISAIVRACLRTYTSLAGSLSKLSASLHISKSTLQHQRAKVLSGATDPTELWAINGASLDDKFHVGVRVKVVRLSGPNARHQHLLNRTGVIQARAGDRFTVGGLESRIHEGTHGMRTFAASDLEQCGSAPLDVPM